LQRISSPLLIVWDRLPAHRSRLVGEFLDQLQGWIVTEYLPPYARVESSRVPMGALEAARTAQRLSAAPVAIERRRPAHPAALAPTPATRTSFLETVFACSRLSYIMRSSVGARWNECGRADHCYAERQGYPGKRE